MSRRRKRVSGRKAASDHRGGPWAAGLPALAIGCAAVALAWAVVARVGFWRESPEVPLLLRDGPAEWIVPDGPLNPFARGDDDQRARFRLRFSLDDPVPAGAEVQIGAFRRATVSLDGRRLAPPRVDLSQWKSPLHFELPPLAAGEHELAVVVSNVGGPPALRVRSDALGIASTGPRAAIAGSAPTGVWESTRSGESFAPVIAAAAPRRMPFASAFPAPREALRRLAPVYAAVFLLVAFAVARHERAGSRPRWIERAASPSSLRWLLLGAWALLAVRSVAALPLNVGFDWLPHLEYVTFVASTLTVPLPGDGWQTFQSPLYYLLSAPIYSALGRVFEPERAVSLLRILSLAAGAALVQLSYTAVRRILPGRADLQRVGTLVGSLLPMNLYLCQALGNEPLTAALSSGVLALSLGLVAVDERGAPVSAAPTPKSLALLGLLLGLALLSKATAFLLVPIAVLAMAWRLWRDEGRALAAARRAAVGAAVLLGTAFATAGWYYVRNWVVTGRPFTGGWDRARGIVWWQDPGYRTGEQLLQLGEVFRQPVYAATAGFWDGVWSTFWTDGYLSGGAALSAAPPWNYAFMASGALLALVPAALIVAGVASIAARPARPWRRPALLAALAVALHLAAMLDLFLAVPFYSTTKATYTAGLTVGYALLAAAGFELLGRTPLARAVLGGALAAWAVGAYAAYLVL